MNSSALQDRRVWIGGGLVVALIIAAATWFLLISPERSSASDLRSQAANTESQNALIVAKNAKLARQGRNMASLKASLLKALDSLPPASGLPEFTNEVTLAASLQSVGLTSITVAAPTSAAPTGTSTVGTEPAATPTTSAPATPAPTATTGATPGTASASTQISIPITILTTGPLAHQAGFLAALEKGPRRVLVTGTQLAVGGNARVSSVDASSTMTTSLTVFCAPMTPAELAQLKKTLAASH